MPLGTDDQNLGLDYYDNFDKMAAKFTMLCCGTSDPIYICFG